MLSPGVFQASGAVMPRPKGDRVLLFEAVREGDELVLSYRDRSRRIGGTLRLSRRGAANLAKLLRDADPELDTQRFVTGEVEHHVG